MSKKTVSYCSILFLFFAPIIQLNAQIGHREVGVKCTMGHFWHEDCNGTADCDRVLKEHLCKEHNHCDDNSSSRRTGGKINFSSPVVSGFVGGGFGLLAGSLINTNTESNNNNNGEGLEQAGIALGYGIFSACSLVFTSGNRSVVENIVLGGIAGGTIGYGIAQREKALDNTKPDKTMERALEGGAGGLILGAILGGKSKKHLSFNNKRTSSLLSCMAIGMSGNRIGILVKL